jgi:hypothetical protein
MRLEGQTRVLASRALPTMSCPHQAPCRGRVGHDGCGFTAPPFVRLSFGTINSGRKEITMVETICERSGRTLYWDWSEAFAKFGFGDGDGQVETPQV